MRESAQRKGALEAILMVASEPVPLKALAFAIDTPEGETLELLRQLQNEYASDSDAPRGFQIREVGGGWRFYSNPHYADVVAGFVTAGTSSRLSQPALETLAVIAYKQPVTRAQIAQIRGVEVDSVVRTLQTRGLVEQIGVAPATGAGLYGTSELFLEKMGMNSLEELAPLAPYLPGDDELEEIEKELP
ncbi:segregation and condensation protein B [Arcanobacterium wilhelmae]|uniref:Segregation and condensation protein B n=1 Tax=Arcanobacterium wilhelmae TaxID=1803177 RepID=A0ABT9N9W0_9ACTO|nr:SMC-Scp complex subunit ScpB [Arcanobacterium wilhelmae]MDP9800001.1 segregation and condensation protein B [Arcanobacterium wilhelmae]WFN89499.1 SMC-Scp complex subunit ScpB [Arcanobacterium wilhelmae]